MRRLQLGYFLTEGVRGIFLHGFMSFAAVGVIAACLVITGSVSLIAYNVDRIINEIQGQNEILVIIDEKLTDAEARSVGTRIAQIANVAERDFISRERAWEEWREQLGDSGYLFETGEVNPLRNRFIVRVADVSLMAETVSELKNLSGVAKVNAQIEVSDFVLGLRQAAGAVSITLIVTLLLVSVFIISNTVKLATFDRREEIAIMRVVGATNAFIRWPFVVEGFLLGMCGAVAAFFVQWGLYNYITGKVSDMLELFKLAPFTDMLALTAAAFLLFGFVAGTFGSALTIRKFLRV